MTDEKKPNLLTTAEDEETTAGDAVIDLISGSTFPDPIRRNVFKAMDRLCSVLIDIPVGALERASAEKRTEAEGRIKIREEITAQIVQQMKVDPEYARRAVNRYGEKILREQGNLDKIFAIGADLLKKDKSATSGNQDSDNEEKKIIEDDWLNSFEKEASQKSTEEMQLLFGRILAGEIRKPGSFSIRAVKILSELDQSTATLFKKLCSVCIGFEIPGGEHILDIRAPSLGGNAGSNVLSPYGLSFDQLNVLHEYGLIIQDYNSRYDYRLCIANDNAPVTLPFRHQGRRWVLLPTVDWKTQEEFRVTGVMLSQAGRELFRIVNADPMEKYTEDLKKFFAEQKLQMIEVPSQEEAQPDLSHI